MKTNDRHRSRALVIVGRSAAVGPYIFQRWCINSSQCYQCYRDTSVPCVCWAWCDAQAVSQAMKVWCADSSAELECDVHEATIKHRRLILQTVLGTYEVRSKTYPTAFLIVHRFHPRVIRSFFEAEPNLNVSKTMLFKDIF